MKISRVAKEVGVSAQTLRNLDRRGVISIRRAYNGYRDFTPEEVRQISEKLFPGRNGFHQEERE